MSSSYSSGIRSYSWYRSSGYASQAASTNTAARQMVIDNLFGGNDVSNITGGASTVDQLFQQTNDMSYAQSTQNAASKIASKTTVDKTA